MLESVNTEDKDVEEMDVHVNEDPEPDFDVEW